MQKHWISNYDKKVNFALELLNEATIDIFNAKDYISFEDWLRKIVWNILNVKLNPLFFADPKINSLLLLENG